MQLNFSKMHGLGNDFVMVDNVTQNVFLNKEQIIRLADRHRGIGFDQLLLVEPPYDPEVDFHYRIFNADGSEVAQCGNGARCFARFVRLKGLTNKRDIKVSTRNGVMTLRLEGGSQVSVNMGQPGFAPEQVPFKAPKEEQTYILRAAEETFLAGVLGMGNPHCILLVESVDQAPVRATGQLLTHHERFPEGANISFLELTGPHSGALRVYERGAGETQACGSGACAAAVWAIRAQKLAAPAEMTLPGGTLTIDWEPGGPVWMRGPAEHVFDGQVQL